MDLEAKKLDDMNQEDISLCDQLRDALLSWGENILAPHQRKSKVKISK